MLKKILPLALIFSLLTPVIITLQPKQAGAVLPSLAYWLATNAARAGIGKFRNATQLALPLKPHRGKLYNLLINKNTAAATGSLAAHTALILGLSAYFDSNVITCLPPSSIHLLNLKNGGYDVTYYYTELSVSEILADKIANGLVGHTSITLGIGSETSSTVTQVTGSTYANGSMYYQGGDISCNKSTSTLPAFDVMKDDYIPVTLLDSSNLEDISDSLHNSFKDTIQSNPSFPLDGSEGLSIEEVSSITFDSVNPDGSTTTHTYTIDSNGQVLLDGELLPDEANLVDINGIEHTYTYDPVTGQLLDNGTPVGEFSTWTDADGTVHVVTSDPITGQLLVDGEPWNPNYTVSDPSTGGTTTTDPTTGTTTNGTIDFTPVTSAISNSILEQKKTNDALSKLELEQKQTTEAVNANTEAVSNLELEQKQTTDSLNDIYTSTNQTNETLNTINDSLQDIYAATQNNNNNFTVDTYTADNRPMNMNGLTSHAQSIINNSPLNSWANAFNITTTVSASLPIWTLDLFSFGLFTFNMNDYSLFFDGLGIVLLIGAAIVSIRVVFRT